MTATTTAGDRRVESSRAKRAKEVIQGSPLPEEFSLLISASTRATPLRAGKTAPTPVTESENRS
jgi:hypothetical protein